MKKRKQMFFVLLWSISFLIAPNNVFAETVDETREYITSEVELINQEEVEKPSNSTNETSTENDVGSSKKDSNHDANTSLNDFEHEENLNETDEELDDEEEIDGLDEDNEDNTKEKDLPEDYTSKDDDQELDQKVDVIPENPEETSEDVDSEDKKTKNTSEEDLEDSEVINEDQDISEEDDEEEAEDEKSSLKKSEDLDDEDSNLEELAKDSSSDEDPKQPKTQLAAITTASQEEAMIIRGGYTIDDKPWGTPGYQRLGITQDYLGSLVSAVGYSENNKYILTAIGEQELGWIDYKAFLFNPTVSNNYVVSPGYSMDDRPWNESGSSSVGKGKTDDHISKKVNLYDVSDDEKYYFAKDANTDETLGWIDYKAFADPDEAQDTMIVKTGYTIDDKPWGEPGYQRLGITDEYLGSTVKAVAHSTGNRYVFATMNDASLGWIDNKAFTMNPTEETNYIVSPGYSIDGRPWNESGSSSVGKGRTNDHISKEVTIYDVSDNGKYYFAKDANTNETLGWIDYKAFADPDKVQDAMIVRTGYTIDDKPWGEPGYQRLGVTDDYLGAAVKAITFSEGNRYVFTTLRDDVLGWIDNKALVMNPIANKNFIIFPDYSIDGRPWGEQGSESVGIGKTDEHLNKAVDIYDVSDNGSYYFAKDANTNETLGWIDNKAFGNMQGESKNIMKSGYTIDTRPWGEPGYERVSTTDNYLKETVQIIGTSSSGSYSAAVLNNTFLGWIDNKAFELLIYLDPGHGGYQTGTAHYGIVEKDLNLSISFKLRDRLENQGYNVVMSRTDDSQVDLYDRPAEANALEADIFVSVHNNAMPGSSSVNGIETYYYQYDDVDSYKPQYPIGSDDWNKATSQVRDDESEKLAEAIHDELITDTNAADRGTREMGFAVTRETFMPAVLLELGYVSNYNEAHKLNSNWYQNVLADAVVSGINNYFNM